MRKAHLIDLSDFLRRRSIPVGPPLHLEERGRATELLRPFLTPDRFARLSAVLGQRTRHITTLIDAVHDPHNISACIRSSDAFGFQDLHVIPPHDKKSAVSTLISKGAQRWLSIHVHDTAVDAITALRQRGYRIVAAGVDPVHGASSPEDIDLSSPVCIVLGNERDGVSDALCAAADEYVHIPMHGFVESLNISVAFALLMRALRLRLETNAEVDFKLSGTARTELMDLWMLDEIPQVRTVFRELSKRSTDSLSSGDGSA